MQQRNCPDHLSIRTQMAVISVTWVTVYVYLSVLSISNNFDISGQCNISNSETSPIWIYMYKNLGISGQCNMSNSGSALIIYLQEVWYQWSM